jgi:predicted phosphohydrolase
MALYAIGDLHLSLNSDKPMDVFGGGWDNYVQKIKDGFSALGDSDTCVLCGDSSWAMSLEESLDDFKFIDSLPGKKLILKGNHDYWWSTVTKTRSFFSKHGIKSIEVLNNNSFLIEGVSVCGTRGWFYEEESGSEHDKKIMAREIGRLEASLSSAEAASGHASAEKICFLHYPPIFRNYECREVIGTMERHGVRSCWYGHLHGQSHRCAVTGLLDGIDYHLVSADFVGFKPIKVL